MEIEKIIKELIGKEVLRPCNIEYEALKSG